MQGVSTYYRVIIDQFMTEVLRFSYLCILLKNMLAAIKTTCPAELETMKTLECEGNQPGATLYLQNRSKDIIGVEANYALKLADNPPKRFKLDEHEVAMLGKKRARRTVIINDEDVKQAGIMTISTPQASVSWCW
uniref:Uncharacterized protein n=1 Tax=Aegilops tauschii subsp. strangulata TaxID=200361 RepID=A0A453JPC2_AEGTS